MAYLKDLSAILGLSVSTVSKALRGYPDVSEETRKRVLRTAEEIGYIKIKDGNDRRDVLMCLKGPVGFLVPDTADFVDAACLGELLRSIAAETLKYGRDLVIIGAGRELRRRNKAVLYGVAGVCFLTGKEWMYGENIADLQRSGIPMAGIEMEDSGSPDEAGRAAVRKLIALAERAEQD